jgi:hypothetical protein
MAAATTPVSITPEAEARIDELGIRREVEQMLEYTRQLIPGLRSIEVSLFEDLDEPGDPLIAVMAWQVDPVEVSANRSLHDRWLEWFVRAFPAAVTRWVTFDVWEWDGDGR